LEKGERGRIQGLPEFFGYPLLSQERIKLRTSNFVGLFIGSIETKAHENVGNSSRGCSQGVPKIFGHPRIYRAHCAVIFAIARPSCQDIVLVIPGTHAHTDARTAGKKDNDCSQTILCVGGGDTEILITGLCSHSTGAKNFSKCRGVSECKGERMSRSQV